MYRRATFMLWSAPAISLLTIAALALAACQLNPLAVAQTPEQKYAAVKLTYDALLTATQTFVADGTVAAGTRREVQTAVGKSGELYRSLNGAYVNYIAAKTELAAGTSSADKVKIASANLEQWTQQLEASLGAIAVSLKH